MNELDDVWEQMLAVAIKNAQAAGRGQVAEYLQLKASNDAIRSTGCKWLFDSFLEISEEVNKLGIKLDIEKEEPHRFEAGRSTMVGWLLRFRFGLRALTIEAGWPRTPGDGFVRGGGLACGRITHFGVGKANAELLLAHSNDKIPEWFAIAPEKPRKAVYTEDLKNHFNVFLDIK